MSLEPKITFRALARTDLPILRVWLNTPHVYEWWGRSEGIGALGGAGDDAATEKQVEAKYGPNIDSSGSTHRFIIEVDGRPIGLIQWYRLCDFAEYARAIGEDPALAAGIDLPIGEPKALGRGLGSRALDKFMNSVIFSVAEVKRVVAGPAADNARSIRAFDKAGFQWLRNASVLGERSPEAVMVRTKT